MTIITLDSTLKEIEWNENNYPRPTAKDSIETSCLFVESDYHRGTATTNEKVFRSSIPSDAVIYHQNYLGYLSSTYGHHNSIVLAPQHFWYTLVCEIAQAVVGQPNIHRKLFTRDPEKKIDILVEGRETDPLRMDAIYNSMVDIVPIDTTLFLPKFSTETEMSRLASLAAFLETCSPYYNYMMYLCGHPQIKILGNLDDWNSIVVNLEKLQAKFSMCVKSPVVNWIVGQALPTAKNICSSLDGDNEDWFKTIFTEKRCGSGGQIEIDGWYSRLFLVQPKSPRFANNFSTHVTKVPYVTLPSETKWNLCFGLFSSSRDAEGFMIPEFSWVQVQKLKLPLVTNTDQLQFKVEKVSIVGESRKL